MITKYRKIGDLDHFVGGYVEGSVGHEIRRDLMLDPQKRRKETRLRTTPQEGAPDETKYEPTVQYIARI